MQAALAYAHARSGFDSSCEAEAFKAEAPDSKSGGLVAANHNGIELEAEGEEEQAETKGRGKRQRTQSGPNGSVLEAEEEKRGRSRRVWGAEGEGRAEAEEARLEEPSEETDVRKSKRSLPEATNQTVSSEELVAEENGLEESGLVSQGLVCDAGQREREMAYSHELVSSVATTKREEGAAYPPKLQLRCWQHRDSTQERGVGDGVCDGVCSGVGSSALDLLCEAALGSDPGSALESGSHVMSHAMSHGMSHVMSHGNALNAQAATASCIRRPSPPAASWANLEVSSFVLGERR